jgi:choline dehydrogenase
VEERWLWTAVVLIETSFHRGTAQAYDLWAETVGDKSFEFKNLLPYFRKSVHYSPPNTKLRAANASVPNPRPEAYSPEGGP